MSEADVGAQRSEPAPDGASDAASEDKKVSWAELFFDLVFVVAVTRVSALVEHDHTGGGLFRALIVFVPIYWVWVGTAIRTNLLDTARAALRLRIFAVGLAAVFMALSVGNAYHDLGLTFAISYWVARILLGASDVTRGGDGRWRVAATPYSISMLVTGPLLVVGALVHGDLRIAIWAVAAVNDLSTPSVLKGRLQGIHLDPGHLAERFGLFVLIALGESVVASTSADARALDLAHGAAVAAAFVVVCGLWWTYFHFAADAMRHAMATARVQLDITRRVLSYAHLALIAAIVVIAVGLRESIAHPGRHLSGSVVGLLYGGAALYLASFGFTRWAMFRAVSSTRLTAAATVLVLGPLATLVPATVALILLAAVLIVLNVEEWARVTHRARRVRLRRQRAPS